MGRTGIDAIRVTTGFHVEVGQTYSFEKNAYFSFSYNVLTFYKYE
jgi:hypothetical protein